MKLNFSIFSLVALLAMNAAGASEKRDCGGDFKLPSQAAQGQAHSDVERAGVILCKNYGKDEKIANDRYAILLGHDRKQNFWNFQAGKVEKQHKYTTDTASAELREETGGLVQYSAAAIRNMPFIYSGQKQLFFLFNPADKNISVRAIRRACKVAVSNKKLPHCMREVDDAADISVIELLRVAKLIKDKHLGHQKTYSLLTRHSQAIQIDGFYMRIIANRYDEARQIFNQLFKVNIF